MQLDMLQDDLFSDHVDAKQETASRKQPASAKKPNENPSGIYKKVGAGTAQVAAHSIEKNEKNPRAPEEKENEFPSTATLRDVDPADRVPVNLPELPVLSSDETEPVEEGEESEEQQDASAADGKAPGAFKTISEAAGFLGVPQHVLRFWESRFSQIKPLKMRGGRRYYRPEDMEVLSTIQHLLYKQGYTIKGAKKVFSTRNREALEAAQRDSGGIIAPIASKADKPDVLDSPLKPTRPAFDERKKKQLSTIRNELLGLRETLSTYLN